MTAELKSDILKLRDEFTTLANKKFDDGYIAISCKNLIARTLSIMEAHFPDEVDLITEFKHDQKRIGKYYEDNFDASKHVNDVFPIKAFTKRLQGFIDYFIERRLS